MAAIGGRQSQADAEIAPNPPMTGSLGTVQLDMDLGLRTTTLER